MAGEWGQLFHHAGRGNVGIQHRGSSGSLRGGEDAGGTGRPAGVHQQGVKTADFAHRQPTRVRIEVRIVIGHHQASAGVVHDYRAKGGAPTGHAAHPGEIQAGFRQILQRAAAGIIITDPRPVFHLSAQAHNRGTPACSHATGQLDARGGQHLGGG